MTTTIRDKHWWGMQFERGDIDKETAEAAFAALGQIEVLDEESNNYRLEAEAATEAMAQLIYARDKWWSNSVERARREATEIVSRTLPKQEAKPPARAPASFPDLPQGYSIK